MTSSTDLVEARNALATLLSAPADTWRRFRLLIIQCGTCQLPLIEVMLTPPMVAVLIREGNAHPATPNMPEDLRGGVEISAWRRDQKADIRIRKQSASGRTLFLPDPRSTIHEPSPTTTSSGEIEVAGYPVCRCTGGRTFSMPFVLDLVRKGVSRHVVPANG